VHGLKEEGSPLNEREDEEDHKQDYEKKRKKRTKEDIEREALLMGDLYATLGLDDITYEASDA